METQNQPAIEPNNAKLQISLPTKKPNALLGWLTDKVTILAEAFGEPMTAARLKVYAGDLVDLERSQLEIAFSLARRELKFFPKISELRALAGLSEAEKQDAEARKAWDVLTAFVRKYVSNDVYGNFGPEHGWYPKNFPKLSDRILDTVRRTGTWKAYKCMDGDDMPFVQKRFFEEYRAWTAVEKILPAWLLTETPHLQLAAKPMAQAETANPKLETVFKPKRMPQPMTEAQLRDRREMLKQQTAALLKDRDHAI